MNEIEIVVDNGDEDVREDETRETVEAGVTSREAEDEERENEEEQEEEGETAGDERESRSQEEKRETRRGERKVASSEEGDDEGMTGDASWFRDLMLGRVRMPFDASWKFVAFIVFIFFVYITNHIEMESRMRRISDLTAEIKELKYEHITTQSELMNMSKQSEVLRRAEAEQLGLHELTEPPRIVQR